MVPIGQKYRDIALKLVEQSTRPSEISGDNVFQEGNERSRKLVETIVDELVLPGSRIDGFEHLEAANQAAAAGKSCLILMEHYSNFDIPCFYYLAGKLGPRGTAVSQNIVSMAGMKLNQESKFVLAFTEAYTRIVIYPSRSLTALAGTPEFEIEKRKSNAINRAALHEMVRQKHDGKLILVFPAGTRYRPGVEETRRGLKEVDSYVKSFDLIVPIGIAGNVLRINAEGGMSEDFATQDVVVYKVGEVIESTAFRDAVRAKAQSENEQDLKQVVADAVMARLGELHEAAELLRASLR